MGVPVEITNSIGMKLVLIPPGEFMMGSPKELIEEELKAHGDDQGLGQWYKERLAGEGPQHRVRITKAFYLGRYLVTQEEYQRVVGNNPSEFSATGQHKDQVAGQDTKRFPVENVSWGDAVEFCRKLSEMPEEKAAGRTYLLPSEAQWEYACRAGSTGRYSFSSARNLIRKENEEKSLSDYGWFPDNAGGRVHPVGLKRGIAWGLYDMQGDVWEWCAGLVRQGLLCEVAYRRSGRSPRWPGPCASRRWLGIPGVELPFGVPLQRRTRAPLPLPGLPRLPSSAGHGR